MAPIHAMSNQSHLLIIFCKVEDVLLFIQVTPTVHMTIRGIHTWLSGNMSSAVAYLGGAAVVSEPGTAT